VTVAAAAANDTLPLMNEKAVSNLGEISTHGGTDSQSHANAAFSVFTYNTLSFGIFLPSLHATTRCRFIVLSLCSPCSCSCCCSCPRVPSRPARLNVSFATISFRLILNWHSHSCRPPLELTSHQRATALQCHPPYHRPSPWPPAPPLAHHLKPPASAAAARVGLPRHPQLLPRSIILSPHPPMSTCPLFRQAPLVAAAPPLH
jgi:hypothetical protein